MLHPSSYTSTPRLNLSLSGRFVFVAQVLLRRQMRRLLRRHSAGRRGEGHQHLPGERDNQRVQVMMVRSSSSEPYPPLY